MLLELDVVVDPGELLDSTQVENKQQRAARAELPSAGRCPVPDPDRTAHAGQLLSRAMPGCAPLHSE